MFAVPMGCACAPAACGCEDCAPSGALRLPAVAGAGGAAAREDTGAFGDASPFSPVSSASCTRPWMTPEVIFESESVLISTSSSNMFPSDSDSSLRTAKTMRTDEAT